MPVQSNAQPVSPARYDTCISGELGGETSATACPNITCDLVMFKAAAANGGNVYIGGTSGVTKKDATTDATTGFQLAAGDTTPWLPVTNLNLFWYICDNAGDDITYIGFK